MDRYARTLAGGTHDTPYIHAPGELLVHVGDCEVLESELHSTGYEQHEQIGSYWLYRAVALSEASVPATFGGFEGVRVSPHLAFGACQRIPRPAARAEPSSDAFAPLDAEPGDFTVGVIDTGVVLNDSAYRGQPHPWLAGHVVYRDGDEDVLEPDEDSVLDVADGHGTFVAGLVLREAPRCRVRVVGALDEDHAEHGSGFGRDQAVAAAIDALAAEGVKLVNLSFSGDPDFELRVPVLIKEAIDNAVDQGTVVIAAAGNFGDSSKVYPAAFENVIAVAAVDDGLTGGGRLPLAAFSSYGEWVDVYAAGVSMLGPYCWFPPENFEGWARWSGTSFASATVTGAIARMVTEGTASSVDDATQQILDAAPAISPAGIRRPFVARGSTT